MNHKNIGIIIQARVGSTRLPGKIIKPFYKKSSILDILISNLKKIHNIPVVLATSGNKENNPLKHVANKYKIDFYQGDEQDVLSRFVEVADKFNFSHVVRVCADNPFFQIEYIIELISSLKELDVDYLSFQDGYGTPVIKTHLGLFGELITTSSLKKISNYTSDIFYKEHVTNFIYGNTDLFKVHFLDAPNFVFKRNDLRFTLDDEVDFKTLKQLYVKYHEEYDDSIEELINFVDNEKHFLELMNENIKKHSK